MEKILVINPGSTSTKIAIYEDRNKIYEFDIIHQTDELSIYNRIVDQENLRRDKILEKLEESNFNISDFTAIAARGGLLRPVQAGTYIINEKMVSDLKECKFGEHASNLGAIIAYDLSKEYNIPAFTADPVSVDEFIELARLTGFNGIERKSLDHPLNVRAIIKKYCEEYRKNFSDLMAVVAHMGGGISVTAFKNGRIIDVSNPNEGGPFSTTRAGALPTIDIVEMCYSGKYDYNSLSRLLLTKAGLVSYLGTNDLKVAIKKMEEGDIYSKEVIDALCYQISKEIGAMAITVKNRIDVILLTGGISNSSYVTNSIKKSVSFLAPVKIYPGSDEMEALAYAILSVKNNEDFAQIY